MLALVPLHDALGGEGGGSHWVITDTRGAELHCGAGAETGMGSNRRGVVTVLIKNGSLPFRVERHIPYQIHGQALAFCKGLPGR